MSKVWKLAAGIGVAIAGAGCEAIYWGPPGGQGNPVPIYGVPIRASALPPGRDPAISLPNLTLAVPPGSREPIAVVRRGDSLSISLALSNTGPGILFDPVDVVISVDARVVEVWTVSPRLQAGAVVVRTGIGIPHLTSGPHEIQVAIDPARHIPEEFENDNVFVRTIGVPPTPRVRH
jgi:hypothetical protein